MSEHLWLRAESRANETRVGLTPEGAATLLSQGLKVTVEDSADRVIATKQYQKAGCEVAPAHSWPDAPRDAIVFGLKELPDDGSDLVHRHIMFGHAFKGQGAGQTLLRRFKAGGGTLLDLEYLTDDTGRRVAAFGYWAGFAGAAVTLMAWAAQQRGEICPPVSPYPNANAMVGALQTLLSDLGSLPNALIIGAKGRVGAGAANLCKRLGIHATGWDMAETANGGPFPEILEHVLFFNCILARQDTPVFVPKSALQTPRNLRVIGDIACDPDSDYNPVPLYSEATTWDAPVYRAHQDPVLDIMAIDNLPSMLPLESSEDFAAQLLPTLTQLSDPDDQVWARAKALFQENIR